MQALILTQHVYQCALHLLHRHRDRTIPESPTSFSHPGLDCFRPVLQLSAFMLPRVRVLPTPHMLLIGPVDAYKSYKPWLLYRVSCTHKCSPPRPCPSTGCTGWPRFGEILIVSPLLLLCSGLHLSIRCGSKARSAARDSDFKHPVFGD